MPLTLQRSAGDAGMNPVHFQTLSRTTSQVALLHMKLQMLNRQWCVASQPIVHGIATPFETRSEQETAERLPIAVPEL